MLFEFLGLVIGKAIFEGIVPQPHPRRKSENDLNKCCRSQVVEPSFAPFFLAKILGKHNSYYDLQSLDPVARKHRTHTHMNNCLPFAMRAAQALFGNLQQLKVYSLVLSLLQKD